MALSRKVRWTFATMQALSKVGILPTNEKIVRWPVEKRLAMGPSKRMVGPVPEVPSYDVQVPTRDGATVRARVYAPPGATRPVLYAHGGGFSMGGISSCDHLCRRLAVEADAVVVSVEYRLAPEHRYPGPLDDVDDALTWLREQDWDTSQLVVGGDSAGGNLAAALALRLRDRGEHLAGQLLVYPALDLTISGEGARTWKGFGLTYADLVLCRETYLGDADPADPCASPLLAPDLTGLAPALVITVEHDPLHDEGVAYAQRLLEAGVPTALLDVADQAHGSLSVPAMYDGIDPIYARMSAFVRAPSLVRG